MPYGRRHSAGTSATWRDMSRTACERDVAVLFWNRPEVRDLVTHCDRICQSFDDGVPPSGARSSRICSLALMNIAIPCVDDTLPELLEASRGPRVIQRMGALRGLDTLAASQGGRREAGAYFASRKKARHANRAARRLPNG